MCFEEIEELEIVTSLEMTMACRILGDQSWSGLPVFESSREPEQNMMKLFLQMVERGLLEQGKNGWKPTQALRDLVQPVMQWEQMVALSGDQRMPTLFWLSGRSVCEMEMLRTDVNCWRVHRYQGDDGLSMLLKKMLREADEENTEDEESEEILHVQITHRKSGDRHQLRVRCGTLPVILKENGEEEILTEGVLKRMLGRGENDAD